MSGTPQGDGQFRPDLEGLRAVAVLLVLLYHAGIVGFAGGYVGVDVFFVLSGFFITGVIHRELTRTGSVNVAAFYARRARRLVPASAVVLLVTLAASALIVPSFTLPGVSTDVASAGLYVSNLRFGVQANDYFDTEIFPSPVLHFWSLSLEEQFYLFWPAALLASRRLPLGRTEGTRILAAILILGVASLAGCLWLTGVNQPWAFFLLPARAWELAVGGLIAVRINQLSSLPPRLAAVATLSGLGLILAGGMLLNDSTPFPGSAALLPVTGSCLVIVGSLPKGRSLPRRLLSVPPMLYLGRISYSLYLWHWPLIVLGTLAMGPAATPLMAVAAVPVAALSHQFLEQPLRYGRLIGTAARWNLVQSAAVAGIVLMASVAAASGMSPQGPAATVEDQPRASTSTQSAGPEACSGCTLADLLPPLDELGAGFFDNCSLTDVSDRTKCVLGAPESSSVIAVFGDSFGWHWMPAFDEIGKDRGLRVLNLVRGACPPAVVTVWSEELNRFDTDCDAWREDAFRRIEAEQPTVVVLASSNREILVAEDGSLVDRDTSLDGPHSRRWIAGLETALQRVSATGARIVIVNQTPEFKLADFDPVPCIAAHPADFHEACNAPRDRAVDLHARAVDRQAARGVQVTFVDPADWLCDSQTCPAVIDRFVVYRDSSGHLTAPFARSRAGQWAAALEMTGR